jgi:molecular chaperone DnaK (HSP70)
MLNSFRRLMGGPPRKAEPAGSAQTPEELTADYLTALIKHLRYILGQKLGAAVLRSVPLEFVLTVPAGWTERAKGKSLAACQRAGLDTKTAVTLVSEPVSN